MDLLIKNGMVIDNELDIYEKTDIGIKDGKIVEVGKLNEKSAKIIIEANGCYVTPGLTDFHCHINYRASEFGLIPEMVHFPYGVTNVVDGGSAGVSNFKKFNENILSKTIANAKAFLLIASEGQVGHKNIENMNPDNFDYENILKLCKDHRDKIIGIKIRLSKHIVEDFGIKTLEKTIEIAQKVGLRVSVHASNPPCEVREILDLLRPGDIFCHVFHQQGNTILGEDGYVLSEVFEAQKRGILFDLARGNAQFSSKIAKQAFKEGFYPNIISSDMAISSLTKQPSMNFSEIMSELLNLGMPFEEIVKRCTEIPNKIAGFEKSDSIKVGNLADIAVFKIIEKDIHYKDFYCNEFNGTKLIVPEMTIKDGLIVHKNYMF